MKHCIFSLGFLLFLAVSLCAQASPVPLGFQDIVLGMDMDSVKKQLVTNPNFVYRGDPDVSMLSRPSETLIECRGAAFIDRAFFQFFEARLFTIILVLDPRQIDHFSVYTRLTEKYGPPSSLSPEESVWESETVRFSLERPLSVKYVDKPVLDKIRVETEAKKPFSIQFQREFLDQF